MEITFILIYLSSIAALLSRNKYLKLMAFLFLLLLLWIIIAGSNTVDLDNYYARYEQIAGQDPIDILFAANQRDRGYGFVTSFFAYLGLDFYAFRMILATVFLSLLVHFSRKVTSSTLLVFCLYIFWSFFMDVIQIRTLIVHLLVFISVYFFAKGDNISKIKSILIMCLACTFHLLALIYLPFFLFHRISKYKIVTVTIFIISFTMPLYIDIVGSALSSFLNLFIYTSDYTSLSTFSRYDFRVSKYAKYVYWAYINGMLILLYFIKDKYNSYSQSNVLLNKHFNNSYLNTCYEFFLYLAAFMPLYGLQGAEVNRVSRCFTLSFITAIVLFINEYKDISVKCLVLFASIVCLTLAAWVILYYSASGDVILMLTDNMIFDVF